MRTIFIDVRFSYTHDCHRRTIVIDVRFSTWHHLHLVGFVCAYDFIFLSFVCACDSYAHTILSSYRSYAHAIHTLQDSHLYSIRALIRMMQSHVSRTHKNLIGKNLTYVRTLLCLSSESNRSVIHAGLKRFILVHDKNGTVV